MKSAIDAEEMPFSSASRQQNMHFDLKSVLDAEETAVLLAIHTKTEQITITKEDSMSEFMYLGLRFTDGIDSSEFNREFCIELEKIDAQIEKHAHVIVADNDLLESLHKSYTAKGGDAVEKKQEIFCERAAELLITTDLSVEEISAMLSFSSSSYFRKIFKKHTGQTPLQIRKNTKYRI